MQDNFSRAILKYVVSPVCKAEVMVNLLRTVYSQYLQGNKMGTCHLMTDDGSENHGAVQHFLHSTESPVLKHIITQRDVEFSNSMIEAAGHKKPQISFSLS